MAKRTLGTAWTRLITRRLTSLTRNALRAGTRAATRAAAKAVRQAAKAAKPTAKPAKVTKPAALRKPIGLLAPVRLPASAKPGSVRKASSTVKTAKPPKPTKPAAGVVVDAGTGSWTTGVALGAAGARRYAVFKPAGLQRGERLPLLVLLHGCTQDAAAFARSTGMNRLATRERCLVLYPEQDRLAQPQACWNWFATRHGRAQAEAALLLQAIDQVCTSQPVDRNRVAVAGLSAGASMAALMVTLQPARFCALLMHSGIAPGTADSTLSALRAMRGGRPTAALAATPAAMASNWPPLLVIHGTADTVVDPRNGAAAAQAWADAAGAVAGPARTVQRGQRRAMTVTDFICSRRRDNSSHDNSSHDNNGNNGSTHRPRRTVATLVLVAGLGHAWSGGAAGQPFSDATGPDASRLLWAFAVRQFRQFQQIRDKLHTPAATPSRGTLPRPAKPRL